MLVFVMSNNGIKCDIHNGQIGGTSRMEDGPTLEVNGPTGKVIFTPTLNCITTSSHITDTFNTKVNASPTSHYECITHITAITLLGTFG